MKIRNLIWAVPMLGILATPALADDDYYGGYRDGNRFEQRLDRQHARIKHGLRNGELTRKEAKRLRRQHRHITRLERRFTRDGRLDRHERRTLRRELDAASDRIYRLKHNDRYRKHYPTSRHKQRDWIGDNGWSVRFSLWDRL